MAIVAALVCASAAVAFRRGEGPAAVDRSPSRTGALTATNSAGRSGAFFLPSGYASEALPLLVMLHGTGGSGRQVVDCLGPVAESDWFIVVAPDSRVAPNGQPSWEVPDHPGEETEDRAHVRACVDEVLAMPGVRIDETRALVAGHSGGASSAPYLASVDPLYTAFAVLHGGVFVSGLGGRRPRGWLSTGVLDPLRPPGGVRAAAEELHVAGFSDVVYREFPGGHDIGEEELHDLLSWWLGSPSAP